MKFNCLTIISFVLIFQITTGQETTEQDSIVSENKSDEYNQWSLEFDAGINKPTRNFTSGYYTGYLDGYHLNGALRYMFNPKIGIGGNLTFGSIESHENSRDFSSNYIGLNLQTYVNLGRILKFEEFAERLSLQFHGGIGYLNLYFDSNSPFSGVDDGFSFTKGDDLGVFIAGLRPQYKLSRKFALFLDVTVNGTFRQNINYDGFSGESDAARAARFDKLQSPLYTASIGVSFYIGRKKEHADWFIEKPKKSSLDSLESRLSLLMKAKKDSNKDGISDYLEEKNKYADEKRISDYQNAQSIDSLPRSIKEYINNEYVNNKQTLLIDKRNRFLLKDYVENIYIYFDFDIRMPARYSIPEINKLKLILEEYKNLKVELIGYADELGSTQYNDQLTADRAKDVKKILVELGIDPSRITTKAGGEDNSVDKNSKEARHIVRRVKFKLYN